MKRIIIATIFTLLLLKSLFAGMNERLEAARAQYWRAEYERLWAFCKMTEIPVRNLVDGTILVEKP